VTDIELISGAEAVVWDLSCLYQSIDDPAIETDMAAIRERAEAWAAQYRGRVARMSAAQMHDALRDFESIKDSVGRLASFAQLTYATDTNNAQYGVLLQKLTEYEAEIAQQLLFFDLEWNALDDNKAQAVLDDSAIGQYRHYLEAERRYKAHRLSEAEEKLLVETAVTGRAAWGRLFTQIWGAARVDYEGEKLMMSQAQVKLYEPQREVRQKAADAITATLKDKLAETTYITNVLAADKMMDDKRRGYATWVSSRNLDNKATDAIVDALVSAVTSSYDIVARHYDLKRRLMGYDTLYDYDRYAPLPIQAAERDYHWDEAREIVQNAYHRFSPRLGSLVERFFDERWIHAALAPGKRGGAFAEQTVPSAHPYIFLSYSGKRDNIRTLAHELGHGVHMALAQEKQGLLGSTMRLTMAEMASIFGEILVFDDLMQREPDPAAQLSMVAKAVEDSFSTVYRQVSMNRFGDLLHNARRAQGELTTEQINDLWMETQRAMFEGSVNLRDEYAVWWSYIPHFVQVPGYVYAYAFGKLLVLSLFNLYQRRGADFVPQYLEVLAAGDADYPENILAPLGIDLANPAFWNEGVESIRAMVEQEERLAREVFPERF
jgi:oligoendopeptidase F